MNELQSATRALSNRDRLRIALFLASTLVFSVLGQHYFTDLPDYKWDAAIFYALALLSFWRVLVHLGVLSSPAARSEDAPSELVNWPWPLMFASVGLAVLAYVKFADNTFTRVGTLAWVGAVLLFLIAMWPPIRRKVLLPPPWLGRWHEGPVLHLKWRTVALIAIIMLAAFFRLYKLDQVPPEMTSDHIEKLLDIHDLYNGLRPIYFERNTGREPFQFYWAFTVMRVFNTGGTFFGLKLANALIGIITIYGVYLLGRELAGEDVALLGAFFAAVMQWAESITRMALRFPYVTIAATFALWAIARALRTGRRADYLVAGLIFGAGFHGYTAYRAMPIALVVMVALKLLFERPRSKLAWRGLIFNLVVFTWVAALVFLPLARYWHDKPEMFWYRTATRIEGDYGVTAQHVGMTLINNTVRALGMFNIVGDEVWANTVPNKPALDQVGGAFLVLGVMAALYRLFSFKTAGKRRDWPLLMAILTGMMLLAPSILSVAFPKENPSVVRTAGAIPVVAVMVGLGLYVVTQAAKQVGGTWLAVPVLALLLTTTTVINYQRYFRDYLHSYQLSSRNSSEMADAMRGFIATGGDLKHIVIRAYPYWVDTRALALLMNDISWQDTNVVIDKVNDLARMSRDFAPQMYLLNTEDEEGLGVLQATFPQGYLTRYRSHIPGHDFLLFHVPAR